MGAAEVAAGAWVGAAEVAAGAMGASIRLVPVGAPRLADLAL